MCAGGCLHFALGFISLTLRTVPTGSMSLKIDTALVFEQLRKTFQRWLKGFDLRVSQWKTSSLSGFALKTVKRGFSVFLLLFARLINT